MLETKPALIPFRGTCTAQEYLNYFYGGKQELVQDNHKLVKLSNDGHEKAQPVCRLAEVKIRPVQDYAWLNSYIFDKNYRLLLDQCRHPDVTVPVELSDCFRAAWPTTSIHIDEEVGYLACSWLEHNHYHWMFHTLPRLFYYRQAGFKPTKFIMDCSNYGNTDVRFEMLHALGVSSDAIYPLNPEYYYQVDNLISMPAIDIYKPLELSNIKLLRQHLYLDHFVPEDMSYKRLYISRADTKDRQVTNEAEVFNFLKEYNFNQVSLSQLSFYRQVQLFSSAEIIIAPHGAGLANIIFCKPGCNIIELMPASRLADHYEHLANACNLKYQKVICENIKNDAKHNMQLDIDKLKLGILKAK
ncbi:MAG: hypothetical protein RLZ12_571 [Bacillota bacterium]|jgi:capsular polysaccharide biosynthesis protein